MKDQNDAVIAPIHVEAFVANARNTKTLCRWTLHFGDTRTHPEPDPFDCVATDKIGAGVYLHWQLPDALTRGRANLTTNPDLLVHPPIPNRWVVVRYHRAGKLTTAPTCDAGWVVESDHLGTRAKPGTSAYLHKGEPATIGRRHDLQKSPWPGATTDPGFTLTAIGPGLPAFASYQPYNADVLSMHDPLTGVAKGWLSYLVIGWHAKPEHDPVSTEQINDLVAFFTDAAPATTRTSDLVAEALDALGWTTTDTLAAKRSLYVGHVLSLEWRTDQAPLSPREPRNPTNTVNIAMGSSSADALTPLLDAVKGTKSSWDFTSLLNAFHTGFLDVLDTAPGRAAASTLLDDAVHATWFRPSPGGTAWRLIAEERDADTGQPRPSDRQLSALRELNTTQRRLDRARSREAGLRRRLYDLWWARDVVHAPDGFAEKANKQLDPQEPDSLAARAASAAADTREHLRVRRNLIRRFPLRDSDGRPFTLKAVPERPFHEAQDPVSVLCGAGADPTTSVPDAGRTLPCRTPKEVIDSAKIGGKTFTAPSTPLQPKHFGDLEQQLKAMKIPWLVIKGLLGEFSVLEAAAAHHVHGRSKVPLREALTPDGDNKRLPAVLAAWEQPWSPLYLMWDVGVHPLPFGMAADGTKGEHWTFRNGRFRFTTAGKGTAAESRSAAGRAGLAPVPMFTLSRRADAHRDTYSAAESAAFHLFAQQVRQWDLLSQPLDGVNAWPARRRPGFDDPSPKSAAGRPVMPAPPSTVPDPHSPQGWSAVRTAQFAFSRVVVVDRFGQTVTVVRTTEPEKFPPRRADSVDCGNDEKLPKNNKCHLPQNTYRYVHLAPRLHQPARLRLDLLSARTGGVRPLDPHTDPDMVTDTAVCGWLMLRRTGRGTPTNADSEHRRLVVFDAEGRGLGELGVIGPSGRTPSRRAVGWRPLHGSRHVEPADVFADTSPHLPDLLRALVDRNADAIARGASTRGPNDPDKPRRLHELLNAVETGLMFITPVGDDRKARLTQLVGRPLALVRLRLSLDLDTAPLPAAPQDDANWTYLHSPPPDTGHPLWTMRWPVQLGKGEDLRDGLIGYYAHAAAAQPVKTVYDAFHLVHKPNGTGHTYVTHFDDGHVLSLPARPVHTEDPSASRYVTLLMDPWSEVTAAMDIVPATSLRLAPGAVDAVLSRLHTAVPVDALLAPTRHGTTSTDNLVVPLPTEFDAREHKGTWWERTGRDWHTTPIEPADPAARLPHRRPEVRSGFLTITSQEDQR